MAKRQVIQKPIPKWGHKGDTFREIIDEWEKLGLVQVEASKDRFVWWGRREVLLHDHPRIENDLPEFKCGLFGNMQHENGLPWIFWGRNPRHLEKTYNDIEKVPIKYRMWKSLFIGKVENDIQMTNRFQMKIDWSKYIQNFIVVKGVQTQYPYTPADYLYAMSRAKFAFLLPGYGPKCNRDIEAVAMGAVPVVTPGVCTEYYDNWVEGENYLKIENEGDIELLNEFSIDHLQDIQQKNYEWYERNCTFRGSFETTKKIIEENYGK